MATIEPNPRHGYKTVDANGNVWTTYYSNSTGTPITGTYTAGSSTGSINYPFGGQGPWVPNTPFPPWQPQVDPLPPYADIRTARANLQKQLELLESFEDGLIGDIALKLDDAMYFLRETLEHIDKIIGDKKTL